MGSPGSSTVDTPGPRPFPTPGRWAGPEAAHREPARGTPLADEPARGRHGRWGGKDGTEAERRGRGTRRRDESLDQAAAQQLNADKLQLEAMFALILKDERLLGLVGIRWFKFADVFHT